jgi:DnaJ-class molecular chaperone
MNLYDELELPKNCSEDDIKQQYRSLAQKHHPDKGGDEEKFKTIKFAYEVLSDPIRRKEYDSTGNFQKDNSIQSEALTRLSNMISQYTEIIHPEHDDLIQKMKIDIIQTKFNTENNIQTCKEHIQKLNVILNKIKLKTEGENLLKGFTIQRLRMRENELMNFHRSIQVFDIMLDILENYQYGS